ncbi:MAG: hypothetical protein LBD80_05105 [Tannerella sp.]|jgi:hypothetical protein|nr:hypothetical protein [Tannerella sp.]
MKNLMKKTFFGMLFTCATLCVFAQEPDEYQPVPWNTYQQAQTVVLDNGLIRREIDCSNRHVTGKSFSRLAIRTQFIEEQSPEFSLRIDDAPFTGLSEWEHVSSRDTTDANGGKGVILSLRQAEKKVTVELIYLLYSGHPAVYKTLRLTNRGTDGVKIEAVDVESLRLNLWPTQTWVMRQYARYKWLGPYTGTGTIR